MRRHRKSEMRNWIFFLARSHTYTYATESVAGENR
jgi:hypothetical protein